ncbi:unnamed protein product [Thlaspi arvense]|uniref:Uncharacterized protein n=1 Tax=Thlaspi arvense TaxID=13288 RepID=A0AAU9SDP5_THLAR|nr:unnamed protein product [Thlaspi arvense]
MNLGDKKLILFQEASDMELNTIKEVIDADEQAIEAIIFIDRLRFSQREQLRTDSERGQRIMHQLMYESHTQCLHVLHSHRVRSEVALAMSLKILGHNPSRKIIAANFQVAQWTVTTKFNDVEMF